MISKKQFEEAQSRAANFLEKAGIVLTGKERQKMEVADFGLGNLEHIGLEVIVYVNTKRVCAKELVMFPDQTCPEHIHPTRNGISGKEAQTLLESIGLIANMNMIPFDTGTPMNPSGVRLGTAAATTRGMKEAEMVQIADVIHSCLKGSKEPSRLAESVRNLTKQFPIP